MLHSFEKCTITLIEADWLGALTRFVFYVALMFTHFRRTF
jgi:hypothetical protein